jgi:hypothetical protein
VNREVAGESPASEIQRISIGPIVNALMQPTVDVGGNMEDVLDLLESVSAAVIAITIRPGATRT